MSAGALLALVLLAAPGASAAAAAPAGSDAPPGPAASVAPSAAPKPAVGPPPEVTLACAPEPVRVGEPLVCTLTAVHPESVSITVPLPGGAAEVRIADDPDGPSAVTEKRPDGKLQTLRRFQIVPQEPKATVKIPEVRVVWHEATGGEGELTMPARKVPIKRLLENASDPQLRTFKAPQGDAAAWLTAHGPVPFVTTNWAALIAAVVLGGGLLGTALTVLFLRWRTARRRVPVAWVDPRPAHVIALEALDALYAERLPEQGRMKEYYFRLSEVVRAYLERRFEFPAREMTSDEIRAHFSRVSRQRVASELAARGLSPTETAWPPGHHGSMKTPVQRPGGHAAFPEQIQMLAPGHAGLEPATRAVEDFLAETDLVKFADFAPTESAAETVMRAARGIVELTRAPDEPVPGTAPTQVAPT